MNSLLKRLGLGQYFQAYVTAEDGMDTISQRFLSASIKLGRPPNQCVVFESSPAGITAAHNCTMKVCCALHSWLQTLPLQARAMCHNTQESLLASCTMLPLAVNAAWLGMLRTYLGDWLLGCELMPLDVT